MFFKAIKHAGFALAAVLALGLGLNPAPADAKTKVKVGFIGPLTGGTSSNGLGGRNSADLAVKLRNADKKAKYEYEMVVQDDECKPNVAVQVATTDTIRLGAVGQTRAIADRRRMGEAMLLNRMCPGGGWNSGNPVVYGVPGEPAVGPTVWALLALRGQPHRPEVSESLRWLEAARERSEGSASIAQAHWCLRLYGRPVPPLDAALWACYARNQFFDNVLAMSWATLAQAPEPSWLRHPPGGGDRI